MSIRDSKDYKISIDRIIIRERKILITIKTGTEITIKLSNITSKNNR